MFRNFALLGGIVSAASVCGLGWTIAAPTVSEQPLAAETKLDPGRVRGLVAQLGHNDFRQRNAARQRLELYGPEILPIVEEALRTAEDTEVRRNLIALASTLKQIQTIEPTRINISMEQKTIREVVTELGKQSGYKMELVPDLGPQDERERRVIDFEARNLPFWQALENLCLVGGLTYYEGWYGYENFTVRLQHGESEVNFLHVHGPFRVRVQGFNYYRHIHFPVGPRNQSGPANVQRSESLQINLGISVEPKLPMLGASQPIFLHAEDERGQSLLPAEAAPNPNAYYSYSSHRMYMQHLSGPLQPAAGSKSLKFLKGIIPVRFIASQTPRVSVENLLAVKNQTFKDGSVSLTIEEARLIDANLTLKLEVSDTSQKDVPDYAWANAVAQRLEIFDENGKKIRHNGVLDWQHNGGTAKGTIQYYVESPARGGLFGGKPKYKLVYFDWTLGHVGVPFEFRDLPLP